jgi:hypothetical protein
VKTDSIFYRLFKDFPQIFWEIIGNSPDRSDSYQFSSVEIKQTAFRIDGVFLPRYVYISATTNPRMSGVARLYTLLKVQIRETLDITASFLPAAESNGYT